MKNFRELCSTAKSFHLHLVDDIEFLASEEFSFVFNQKHIETREFVFHKNKNLNEIDLKMYIDNIDGNYKIFISDVNNINYEKEKEVLLDLCDIDFDVSLPLKIKVSS